MSLQTIIDQEAKKQAKAIAALEAKFGRKVAGLQKVLHDLIRDRFLDSLARDEAGYLLYNVSNVNRVNNMVKTWEYFQEKHLRPEILQFGKDLLALTDVSTGYYLALGKEYDLTLKFEKTLEIISKQIGITLDKTPKIIPGSYLDRLLDAAQVRDKVINVVLENVAGKAAFTDLKAQLSEVIKGSKEVNGAMEKYMRTYAYDTVTQVQRSFDKSMADNYKMNCFVYEGGLIKESRPFCIEHLGKTICRAEIEELDKQRVDPDKAWKGANPDVPFEISLGGYNCRHRAMWIPDEAVKEIK